ncbi:MAG: hypothetical protein K2K12_01825 [Clostridia bacterium]|nr:hypothetical protein [Clostridia bacterium]
MMMTKRPIKMLPIWIAISSVIILAGIILFALLGFNTSADRNDRKTFEVEYDVEVEIAENGIKMLQDACEAAFKTNGISYFTQQDAKTETVGGKLIYTFSANTSDTALGQAKAAVESFAKETFADKDATEENEDIPHVYVGYHVSYNKSFTEAAWRGAVAVAVGAVVALVYVAIRFGIGSALTGLTLCVHDVLFSLGILAITRIPVLGFVPVIVGAVAAFSSLLMWLIQCMKMRESFKNQPETVSAEEAIELSSKSAQKTIYFAAAGIAIALAIFTVALAIGSGSIGAILFPLVCIIPVGVSVYSSLLFGPALHVPVKTAFDKFKSKHKRRFGRAKAEKKQEEKA